MQTHFVLNNWNYKGYTFGLDIAFGRQSGQEIWVSLALRNNSENYYELCSSLFSAIFENHHWKYQENWRYKKLYNEITNDTEKTKFNLGSDLVAKSEKDGEFVEGSDAAWFIDENTATISIYLKNKPKVRTSGNFSVKLYKVDENGDIVYKLNKGH